ncbi:translation initiation factor IF-2 [Aureibacter tunicatorum]|nr:translation initiation factor IF-2 [Aureibacter tunicatorum]BDD05882.1 translation initiation factor IF-2 [Aureibacter tunicatorum]
MMRLSQVARKLNVGTSTIVEHLKGKGFEVENKPNAKISMEQFNMLAKEYKSSLQEKEEASELKIGSSHAQRNVVIKDDTTAKKTPTPTQEEKKVLIKDVTTSATKTSTKPTSEPKKGDEKASVEAPKLQGVKVLGKIDLDAKGNVKKTTTSSSKPEVANKPTQEKEKTAQPQKKVAEEATKPKPVEKPAPPKVKNEAKPASDESKKDSVSSDSKTADKPKPKEKEEAKSARPSVANSVSENKNVNKKALPQDQKAEQKDNRPSEKIEREVVKEEAVAKNEEKQSIAQKDELITAKADTLKGLTVLGKIELPTQKSKKKPVASSDDKGDKKKKRPRKRIQKGGNDQSNRSSDGNKNSEGNGGQRRQGGNNSGNQQNRQGGGNQNRQGGNQQNRQGGGNNQQSGGRGGNQQRKQNQQNNRKGGHNRKGGRQQPVAKKEELSDKEIQEQIKATLAKLSGGTKKNTTANRSKYRKDKRGRAAEADAERMLQEQEAAKTLQVTEFIAANDLASMMEVSVNDVISACMSMGMFVSINQRLDAEAITLIADEFGYEVDFTTAKDELDVQEVEDKEDDLSERAPIVTIMGHVDHGKTSLLDYIRNSKVTESEAGGITQHIGAYDVMTESGKRIAFLDTPGHEAFTAMRARGAKVTDVVIIVVAADDAVMPQTKEAINHAQQADVPIVIAINKIDKPNANPDKIKEQLASNNILVEDWGGKYQCQEISAKSGVGIEDLLEKVLLESEVLELQANPEKPAVGTIIEASLDKGRGYVATVLVQAGTLRIGDVMLAGSHFGKVKAMFDHRGKRLKEAPPSTPVLVLGLDGAPQAGDKFNVMDTDREAREIATKRGQLLREQSMRTKKHITLDEIGRRLAIGSFKELNIIIKGDVDGSVEALSDSLLKLSTEEVQINIIHKAVGQISESDALLASASDAIIIGFQVRPSVNARRIAEQEQIEIRLYSIIYDAINEIKDAMEGMLDPEMEEVITGNIQVREVFKISKVGTVAGCYVTDGYVKRSSSIRIIREGIVVYTGEIAQLKRFKDDVAEVKQNYECGLSIANFNDIKVDDVIEGFEQREVKRKLK